jgi:dienelactone hydrolase
VFKDIPGFVGRVKVPVLMFAGEADTFRNCCLIETARAFSAVASKASVPFEVVTYPKTNHDFIEGGANYNATSYKDAMERTAAKLKGAFVE